LPVIRRKKRTRDLATFFGMLFFVIVLISVALSIGNLIAYREIISRLSNVTNYVDQKVNQVHKEVESVKALMAPNSLVDKYISAANYLREFGYDFERILANISDDPTTGYFMVFTIGNENVWFSIRDAEKTYFNKELKPGLSDYRFFYFKEPKIRTNYDVIIPPEATITVGKPGRIYLLFFGVGTKFHPTKVVQLTESKYENFAQKFSLYIPGR